MQSFLRKSCLPFDTQDGTKRNHGGQMPHLDQLDHDMRALGLWYKVLVMPLIKLGTFRSCWDREDEIRQLVHDLGTDAQAACV